MLQKIKIFVIVVVCSVFTINIAKAQDKKVFDNVGVYFYPMIDINDSKFYFDGWALGLRTNVRLNNKFLFHWGVGYGNSKYKNEGRVVGFFTDDIYLMADYLSSHLIKINSNLTYKLGELKNNNRLYLLGGVSFNMHFNENYIFGFPIEDLYVYESRELRLYNVIFSIGLGYTYNINSFLKVNVEANIGLPVWKNHKKVIHIHQIANVHVYNTNSGINLGLIYNFKNN